jgi:hypothetical protein
MGFFYKFRPKIGKKWFGLDRLIYHYNNLLHLNTN